MSSMMKLAHEPESTQSIDGGNTWIVTGTSRILGRNTGSYLILRSWQKRHGFAYYLILLPLSLALIVMNSAAYAQSSTDKSRDGYPAKVVRMVVPNPAGGGVDIIARLVSQKLAERLGQPFVVENRPGAGGTTGITVVAKSSPDGYTLGMGVTATLAIAPALYRSLSYDAGRDFEPIALIATLPLVLAVHPSLPVQSVNELIRLARARAGQIDYSSTGNGTPPHLAAELFKALAKVDMVHVPYKGGPPAVNALIGGEVSLTFGTALTTVPYIRTGRLRVL